MSIEFQENLLKLNPLMGNNPIKIIIFAIFFQDEANRIWNHPPTLLLLNLTVWERGLEEHLLVFCWNVLQYEVVSVWQVLSKETLTPPSHSTSTTLVLKILFRLIWACIIIIIVHGVRVARTSPITGVISEPRIRTFNSSSSASHPFLSYLSSQCCHWGVCALIPSFHMAAKAGSAGCFDVHFF